MARGCRLSASYTCLTRGHEGTRRVGIRCGSVVCGLPNLLVSVRKKSPENRGIACAPLHESARRCTCRSCQGAVCSEQLTQKMNGEMVIL